MTINLIQDIETPHNNCIIREIRENNKEKLVLWYAKDNELIKTSKFNNNEPLFNYGKKLNLKFLFHCITNYKEKYIIVGWSNINTALLHIIFFLTRKPFNHWTDLGMNKFEKINIIKKMIRKIAYFILRKSNSIVFCVSNSTIQYLKSHSFNKDRLVHLPIYIQTYDSKIHIPYKESLVLSKYSITKDNFIISAGSRLEYLKGFDLLIKAMEKIDKNIADKCLLIIVGAGQEKENIEAMSKLISCRTIFTGWLEIDNFKAIISNSHIFIQPSRYETFGSASLAMSLGTPVLGTKSSGAAYDRIISGHNGYLYEHNDLDEVLKRIKFLYYNRAILKKLSDNAFKTSNEWPLSRGRKTIINNII